MKRTILITLTLLVLTACHKDIWDKLDDHETRIARLETLCSQFNTNITSLQSLVDVINTRDYVKDVVPVTESGDIIRHGFSLSSKLGISSNNLRIGIIRLDLDNSRFKILISS